MLMSLSFLQLEETLRVDDSWLTVLAARASIVGDVCGGIKAHGKGDIKPKHHWMFDVAEMLDWDLFMVDGFTVERLHLRGKFLLEYISQPSAVENSCLASILTRQVGHLQGIERTSLAISGVLGSKSVEFQGCRVGDSMRIRGFELHVDDVVFDLERGRCGRIVACAAQDEHLMLFLILLRKVEDVTCVANRWREDVACETALCDAQQFIPALGWQDFGDDLLVLQRFATDCK